MIFIWDLDQGTVVAHSTEFYLSTFHVGEVEHINWKINDISEFQILIYV